MSVRWNSLLSYLDVTTSTYTSRSFHNYYLNVTKLYRYSIYIHYSLWFDYQFRLVMILLKKNNRVKSYLIDYQFNFLFL